MRRRRKDEHFFLTSAVLAGKNSAMNNRNALYLWLLDVAKLVAIAAPAIMLMHRGVTGRWLP